MRQTNSFTRKTLYQLKKWHGRDIDLYIRGAVSQNVKTGVPNYPETKWKLRRTPVLEITTTLADNKAQNFAVAGRPFEYGGIFNLNETNVLVEFKDLPSGYLANNNDAFIIDHKRFNVIKTKVLQKLRLIVFTIQELKGQKVSEIYDVIEYLSLSEVAHES